MTLAVNKFKIASALTACTTAIATATVICFRSERQAENAKSRSEDELELEARKDRHSAWQRGFKSVVLKKRGNN